LPRFLRIMEFDDQGRPRIGSSRDQLGVRQPGSRGLSDVSICTDGLVVIENAGLSVNRELAAMPARIVPLRLESRVPGALGRNSVAVFGFGDGAFEPCALSADLEFIVDERKPSHGFIRPRFRMRLDAFQQALASTQPLWVNVESSL
jgi:hypothetical protein